ncbi:protein WVD2-like 3 [Aegilops tauschii subsp. strangulata]|uniref:TPX2 C-terminal domain-containing protein n=2 Tax=Aegilops tauschii subsp. strangulata TaxID=200361 RepID=A0A453M3J0_AEGTS|nr:protein WVD2-like 3 [Aegilops tauschii subsp. strangulata]
MAASGEGGGDASAAARRRWDLSTKGAENIPMVKEAAEISTDEESDGVVICPPDGNTRDCEEVVSGSDHDSSPEGQVTSVEPAIDGETGEDKLINQDSLKLIDQEMSALPKSPTKASMSGSEKSKRTVPQPFALSTQRRASGGGNGAVAHPSSNGEKSGQGSSASPASMIKKSTLVTPKKMSQSGLTFQPQDDDSCSVTSSTTASARAGRTKTTVAFAPTFVCDDRADKRKEFYTKLEEKHKALEAEKNEAETRKKDEQEAALKQLRKSLVIRAKPMPNFYQEGPPPKVELKKVPPTRAKSPKFTRRKSTGDGSPATPEAANTSAASHRAHRHSMGNPKDAKKAQCSPKSGVGAKARAVKPVS